MKPLALLSVVTTLFLSVNVDAAIISVGWQANEDNLITQDTDNSLEWLDLTVTANMSYNQVISELGVGGAYEGWRYATSTEVASLWDAFGGDSNYNGWSASNNGIFNEMSLYIGDLYCEGFGCPTVDDKGFTLFLTADTNEFGQHIVSQAGDYYIHTETVLTSDFFNLQAYEYDSDFSRISMGSALVRDLTVVPVPAAVWLFGSGLLGLVGLAKRKKS
ncbi:MAG: hypothetical protein OEZ38_11390 [Gammaproteobacteria bacterium]|nr:hypothetical protein [Gammaproteobacteria bacterium]